MINKAARIRAAGKPTGNLTKRGTPICKVRCLGCGRDILSNGDLASVEYVRTKRRTELFFHTGCMAKVWGRENVAEEAKG